MISISLVHRVPHELRLHRSGCSCTKSSRAAPMIRGRPSRNRNCNAYSCTPESGKVLTSLQGISSGDDNLPCGCTRRLSRSSHYTLDTLSYWLQSSSTFRNHHHISSSTCAANGTAPGRATARRTRNRIHDRTYTPLAWRRF